MVRDAACSAYSPNGNQINFGGRGHTTAEVGMPEWGFSHTQSSTGDHELWGYDSYRRCCTANTWGGGVLCARIMGLDDE